MIPKDLAKKIRIIEIYTRKAVNDILAGEYESVFKGRGMEFDEVREYVPGDEIRDIDWNVTARMGHPFVKRYVEERELTIMFLADLSASGSFGSQEKTKNEVAAEICALLAFSAIRNNDKVGLIVFTNEIELFIPPRKGASHVLRLIRELLAFEPRSPLTDLNVVIDYLGRVLHKRCVVFLISDFQTEGYEKKLPIMGKRHDVVGIALQDPVEQALPPVGLIELEDAETGETLLMDAGDPDFRKWYEQHARQTREKLKEQFQMMNIDLAEIQTGDDYVKDLIRFFRSRKRR
ncbi:MAG: DUF58 domain-containing protein [SAR324 cluster bacterium]|nr:DUF58 domain-containing protein [SAR324 cluster bacterium]